MRTAPVSEGRSAATRGEDLSRFPLGRGSLRVNPKIPKGQRTAFQFATDDHLPSREPTPYLWEPPVKRHKLVVRHIGRNTHPPLYVNVFFAPKFSVTCAHLKPPTRGTVTRRTLLLSGMKVK